MIYICPNIVMGATKIVGFFWHIPIFSFSVNMNIVYILHGNGIGDVYVLCIAILIMNGKSSHWMMICCMEWNDLGRGGGGGG